MAKSLFLHVFASYMDKNGNRKIKVAVLSYTDEGNLRNTTGTIPARFGRKGDSGNCIICYASDVEHLRKGLEAWLEVPVSRVL